VKLTDLMDLQMVEMELVAEAPEKTLRVLVDRMADAGRLKDREDALRRLVERENVMSTGIGGGIAIPHARTPEAKRTMLAVGRSREGVPFNAVDGEPVKVVFLILGPPEAAAEHVMVLARIARLVKKPEFLEQAAQAATPEEFLALVERLE
jgi:mannitol/fructose-specific phosphotransferase system IIA component (Ntr-type)